MFKILCLDGGGARGYFTSYMIKRIEEKYNIKAYEYFDLIVGTSTGAIIAGGLGLGLDTEEIFEIYEKESKNIFKKRAFPNNGIIGSMFSNEYLLKLISKKYMNKDFFDLKTNLMITSTDVTRAVPVIIKSWEQNDISLIDAVISSSSAPCYFDPFKLNDTYYSDGCIWANNPALIAFSDAISKDSFNKKISEIKILSIGNGKNIEKKEILPLKSIPFLNKSDNNWGIVGWGLTLPSLFLQTSVIANDMILKNILEEENYLRIDYFSDIKLPINEIPKKMIEDKDKVFNKYIEKLDKFFSYEDNEKVEKYNFIQRLAKKIFKI